MTLLTRFFLAGVVAFGSGGIPLVSAQTAGFNSITQPSPSSNIEAGSIFNIKWTVASKYAGIGDCVLKLIGGKDRNSLTPVATIGTANCDTGTYEWAVSSDLGSEAVYGLTIAVASSPTTFQYSMPFSIAGGGASAASSSTGPSSTTLTTSTTGSTSSSTSGTVSSTTEAPTTTTTADNISTDTSSSPAQTTTAGSNKDASNGNSTSGSTGLSIPIIIGIVAGGVVVAALLGGVMSWACARRRAKEEDHAYIDLDHRPYKL